MASPFEHETPEDRAQNAGMMSDDVLITRFQTGDADAFRILVDRYKDRVRTLIFSVLNAPELIDDLAQDVFLRAYRALPSFRFDASFYTWLYRITVNLCRDQMRRRRIRKLVSLQTLLDSNDAEAARATAVAPETSDMRDIVVAALQRLPDHYRTAVVLCDIEDMTYEEIADIMQCSIGTVKSRIWRGREALARILGPVLGIERPARRLDPGHSTAAS